MFLKFILSNCYLKFFLSLITSNSYSYHFMLKKFKLTKLCRTYLTTAYSYSQVYVTFQCGESFCPVSWATLCGLPGMNLQITSHNFENLRDNNPMFFIFCAILNPKNFSTLKKHDVLNLLDIPSSYIWST